jgi:cytochrome P450
VFLVVYYWKRRSRYPLPPGPKCLPIIGSILSIPRDKEWFTFTKWAQQHGPVVYFNVLGKEFVVLNSAQAINDLLVTRGANYANRPALQMLSDLTGCDKISAFLPYGDRLTTSRKLLSSILTTRAVPRWHPEMERASHLLILQLIDDPQELYKHVLLFAGTLILQISHGYFPLRADDPLITQAEQTLSEIGEAFEFGKWWVEFFPWLRYVPDWVPGTQWKRRANGIKKNVLAMVHVPHDMVKAQVRDGTAKASFTSDMLEKPGALEPAQEDMIMWTAHALYSGGTDTSVIAIESFFLLMTMFPDVQRKAKAELDAVVGSDRLPRAADQPLMPFLTAVGKEVLRWHPVAPIALPHACAADDVYGGYFIPKGATVWGNTWLLLHDPAVYPDPHAFNPERFLGPTPQPDPAEHGAFGYGRRRCPAVDFAQASLFTVMALALATLDIARARDASGAEIVPTGAYQHRIISHPLPHPVRIRPRSQAAVELVRLAVGQ